MINTVTLLLNNWGTAAAPFVFQKPDCFKVPEPNTIEGRRLVVDDSLQNFDNDQQSRGNMMTKVSQAAFLEGWNYKGFFPSLWKLQKLKIPVEQAYQTAGNIACAVMKFRIKAIKVLGFFQASRTLKTFDDQEDVTR